MKVCWLTNYYSPYKMNVAELIGKEVELTMFMIGGKEDKNRNDEWILKQDRSFKVVLIDKDFNSTINKLAVENDILIDSMYATSYGIKAVHYFRKNKKKTVLLADGGLAINRGFIIDKLLSIIMKRHDYFFSSSKYTDDYFKYYKVDDHLIYHYNFFSLSKKDLIENEELFKKKEELRKELNIDDKFTFISVGQPIVRKGFDILLNAYIKSGLIEKANIYIVGGKPQKEIQDIVDKNNLTNVHFIDLITSKELKKYYGMADAFILTTRYDIWGLVINEAMSFGLKVITSNKCVAGLHFSDLSPDVLLSDVLDIDTYSEHMQNLFNGYNRVSNINLNIIKEYSIENNAKGIVNNLNAIIN